MADGNKFKETVESLFQGMFHQRQLSEMRSISMEQSFFHW